MASASQTTSDLKGDRRSIKMFLPPGTYPDGIYVDDGVMTNGSPNLTSASGKFTNAAVGMAITVDGAGAGGAILKTTIKSVTSATVAVLNVNASTATSGAAAWWGTDMSGAINVAITWLSTTTNTGGGDVLFPFGIYMIDSPIIMATSVALVGEHSSMAYGWTQPVMRSVIKASANFPANGFIIDNRNGVSNTGFYYLDIIGDGTSAIMQTNATTTGIGFGTANQADGAQLADCNINFCSIRLNKRNLWAKNYGTINALHSNFSSASYISVDAEKYALDDSTWTSCYINSNNWLLVGVSNPLTDIYNGCGLRMGYGCAFFTMQGGKIEYCATGVVLDSGSYKCDFTDVWFDANAKWHARIISNTVVDDIATLGHKFKCQFNGGAYTTAGLGLQGYDAHVLIEGYQNSTIFAIQVGCEFNGCSFKAENMGGLSELLQNYPQFPQNNAIATRVITTIGGVGNPALKLLVSGCDLEHSSIYSGTATASGTDVTWSTGNPFLPGEWAGKIFYQYYYNPYTIASVSSATALTLTTTAGTISSPEPWYVETNGILIDSNFSPYSDIRFVGNRGVVSHIKSNVADTELVWYLVNPQTGATQASMASDGTTVIQAPITANEIVLQSDEAGVVYIGRYLPPGGSNYTGGILDFNDPTSVAVPTYGSIRLAGSEFLQLDPSVALSTGTTPGLLSAHPIFIMGSGAEILAGTGNPHNVYIANEGSIFLRTDGASAGASIYVNIDGASNWQPASINILDINSGFGTIPGVAGAPGGPTDLAIGGGGSNPSAISLGWGDGSGYAIEFLSGRSGGTNVGSLSDQGVLSILHQIISNGWIGAQVSSPSDASPAQSFDAVDGKFSGNLGIGTAADHSGAFPLTVAGAIKCSALTLTGSLTAAGIQDTLLTASRPVKTDGSKNLVSGSIDITSSDVTASGLTSGYFLTWGGSSVSERAPGATASAYITSMSSPGFAAALTGVSLVGGLPGQSITASTANFVTASGIVNVDVVDGLVQ